MRDGRILYQVGAHEVGAYEYHRWVETPDRIVQNALVRLLRSSGKYQSVDTLRNTVKADYIVQGRIYEFAEIDKQNLRTPIPLWMERNKGKIPWVNEEYERIKAGKLATTQPLRSEVSILVMP